MCVDVAQLMYFLPGLPCTLQPAMMRTTMHTSTHRSARNEGEKVPTPAVQNAATLITSRGSLRLSYHKLTMARNFFAFSGNTLGHPKAYHVLLRYPVSFWFGFGIRVMTPRHVQINELCHWSGGYHIFWTTTLPT